MGIDVRTGAVSEFSCAGIAALRRRVRESRSGLREILVAEGKDLEPIFQIFRLVGWSEGRVRKVLREAGVIVTDQGRDGSREK